MTPKLVTIAPSHYCEKSRWALQLAKISFIEEPHAPFFHVPAVKNAGGTRTTPILQLASETIQSSDDITEWIANHPETAWNPYGRSEYKSNITKLEIELGRKLGVLTRLMAYQELLTQKKLVLACMTPAPDSEQRWFSLGFPIFRWMMRKAMNINAASAEKAKTAVLGILDSIESNAHGEFLIGDTLTIADVTFAALTAPLVLPETYGSSLPSYEDLPQKAKDMTDEFRVTPAGQRVLRLYRDHR